MKKKLIKLPIIAFITAITIPTLCGVLNTTFSGQKSKVIISNKSEKSDNYSVTTPSWTHYAVGEKLDLRDLKVTYNDPEKGVIDVTSECKLSKQNNEELTEAGEFDVNIQHNDFNSSFKIYVESEAHEIPNNDPYAKMGSINVKYKLMSNQECIFTEYEDGEGILRIPDYIEHDGVKYFIKQIPSDWSDGENDIEGLEFDDNCTHLKKICDHAFEGTNCLDEYINDKTKLLIFPEGLEMIGSWAFSGTDYGQNKIKGYSFPSTLKEICQLAFGNEAPYIDGDDNNGELHFRSIPKIYGSSFDIIGNVISHNISHDCKWIYGSTLDIARTMRDELKCDTNFSSSNDYLIPRLIGDDYYKTVEVKFGDITAKCGLTGDECQLISYVSGKGTFKVIDHIECDNRTFYIKEIPSNWSNGENDITGLKFECTHLKKIYKGAFANTNCLDYYINHKDELLIFPEGLEEIGESAFFGTDYGQNSIKGYSFPSTLKVIDAFAFSLSPCVDDDNGNGQLIFKSNPTIENEAFTSAFSYNSCIVYGKTEEIAASVIKQICDKCTLKQNCPLNFKILRVLDKNDDPIILPIIESNWGDIKVKCVLKDDECKLIEYVSGTGTISIPDHIEHNGKIYYVKEIPSNWSDGENDITGLEFAPGCRHLKKICDWAFKGTNCLDKFIDNRNELLEFPEGLEEIGKEIFDGTDHGQSIIRGYSFPSTLKKIGAYAFGKWSPFIKGSSNNGELWFRSIPEIDKNAFSISEIFWVPAKHICKYIYAPKNEMAVKISQLIRSDFATSFYTESNFLIPKLIQE